jgi:hypothetical protein
MNKKGLKVPKCEIFDLLDLNDFYVIKFLKVGGLWGMKKKFNFFHCGPNICTILSLLAYAQ